MNKSNWRTPNEGEKKQVLYWMKRNKSGNIGFPTCCFIFLLIGVISFDIALYIFKPEHYIDGIKCSAIIFIPLIFICVFIIFNMITEIEKTSLVSKGEFLIIDAKVQFVGKKSMGRYSYMNVVEASYHSGFGAKPTTFSVSRAIMKKTKSGDIGYVIKFPKGNSWTRKSLVFIPREGGK